MLRVEALRVVCEGGRRGESRRRSSEEKRKRGVAWGVSNWSGAFWVLEGLTGLTGGFTERKPFGRFGGWAGRVSWTLLRTLDRVGFSRARRMSSDPTTECTVWLGESRGGKEQG